MPLIETEAIVLKQFDLGETDKIITFYTKDHGKIRAVVKKARNSKNNKTSAIVLPFCYNNIKVYKSKSLDRINYVENIHRFEELRNNLDKMAYATYFSEMVEKTGMEYHPNPSLFNLLLETFNKMISIENEGLEKINIVFKLFFLEIIGIKPTINYCYDCGKRIITSSRQLFNVKEGGLICSECARVKNDNLNNLKQNEIDLVKRIYRNNINALDDITIDKKILDKLDKLIDEFIIYHLDIKLKSDDFLQIIKGFDKN
jgi:DNA repair protein RecO (recombination protein O)